MICHPGYTDCKDPLCCPAWCGFLNAAEKGRIESVINEAQRYGYLPSSFENVHVQSTSSSPIPVVLFMFKSMFFLCVPVLFVFLTGAIEL